MLISPAYASGGAGFDIMSLAPIPMIFIVMYFLVFRPQQKKAKQHEEMMRSLHKGDKVITASGIIAVVDKIIDDKEIQLEIADGVKIRYLRRMVHEIISGRGSDASKPALKLASSQERSEKSERGEKEETAPRKKALKSANKKSSIKEVE